MEVATSDPSLNRSSQLESLPIELLERICSYVAGMIPIQRQRHRCIEDAFFIRCDTLGKADCKSLRLACKRLAELDTPCKALFRDFHLLSTEDSVGRLEAVALNARLRSFVSRITFFAPFLHERYTDRIQYEQQLERQVAQSFRDRIGYSEDWTSAERNAMVAGLTAACYPYKNSAIANGLEIYRKMYEKQQHLLAGESYKMRVAIALNLYPNIKDLSITREDPCKSAHYFPIKADREFGKGGRDGWLTVHHPEALLSTVLNYSQSDKIRQHEHFKLVVEILALSKLQPLKLVADGNSGVDSSLDWNSLVNEGESSPLVRPPEHLLRVDLLRTLHLNLATHDEEVCDQDWSHCLSPLLKRTSNLIELSLYFGDLGPSHEDLESAPGERHQPPSFDDLFSLSFPCLQELHIQKLRFRSKDLTHFLEQHPNLSTLTLQDFFVVDERWKAVFDAIKSHPSIIDLELCDIRRNDTEVGSCFCISSNYADNGDYAYQPPELRQYIFENGEWTAKLEIGDWRPDESDDDSS